MDEILIILQKITFKGLSERSWDNVLGMVYHSEISAIAGAADISEGCCLFSL